MISDRISGLKVGEISDLSLFTRLSAVSLPCEAVIDAMGLWLKMLGGFELRAGTGAELSLPTRKIRALLSYLAVNADKPQPRERLMALLWSDRGERQARQSLNQALMSIRRLGEHEGVQLLDSDGERVTLRGGAISSDVEQMRSLVADDPATAANLYDGPILEGLSIPDPAFEEWLRAIRSELHALACAALETAANSSDETAIAIKCAQRLVGLDPLHEEAHRRLMQLLYQSGDRAGALRQYQNCADILKRELQVEPDAATKALFEEIRKDARSESKATPTPITPDVLAPTGKPSLAVMPFENLRGGQMANQFADGLTEDLITALGHVTELLVIARQSSGVFKGQAVNSSDVGEALGARYILEGSIRTAGDRLRCSVKLIDTALGHQLWAERYDRPFEDIFALQDEIVQQVLIELQVKLTLGEHARVAGRGTNNLEAWLLRVEAGSQLLSFAKVKIARARELFEAAHRADPSWAQPLAGIAGSYYYEARFGWAPSREESIARGLEFAERAVAMDPADPYGYLALRSLNMLLGKHEEALALSEKALSVAPNDYQAQATYAMTLLMSSDDPNGALAAFERAVRLGPIPPPWVQFLHGVALLTAGRTDRAVSVFEGLLQQEPEHPDASAMLAAAYVSAGRVDDALESVNSLRDEDPTYTVARALGRVYFRNEERTEWLRKLLVKAGLPE